MLSKLSGRNSGWFFPLCVGLIAGVLIAGLAYRIAPDLPGVGGATGVDTQALPGEAEGAPLPGVSGAPGEPGATTGPGAVTAPGAPGAGAPGAGGHGAGAPAAGGSGSGSSGSGTNPGSTGGGGGALTASDVGVTASAIKVGVGLLDLGGASDAGAAVPGFDPKVQRRQWETFFKELNDKGGVLGRKVQPSFRRVNVLSPQDQQAACVEFTQTKRVFLVFDSSNSMGPDGNLCVAAQNRTLMLGSAISPSDYYAAARGLLISSAASGTRVGRAWARTMERAGKLKGKTLGLLVDQGAINNIVKAGLTTELKRLGYKFSYTAVVSNDPSQGPAQVPSHVVSMQRAGVDTVFMASAFFNMNSFVNQAERQNFRPQYMVSDLAGSNVATLLNGMPDSFDGAISLTYYPSGVTPKNPETPKSRDCRMRWNKLTGENVQPGGQDYGNITGVCNFVDLLATAGAKAGPALNRQGFTNTVQGLGRSFDFGGMGGSFGPGKTNYADLVRTMVWGPKKPETDSAYCTSNQRRCFNDGMPPYNPGV